MIDKLDLRIPRRPPFTSGFERVYSELRAMDRGPFRAAKYYEYAGDLRKYGFHSRLSQYCVMDKIGNHKLELIDVGEMTKANILNEITQIFDIEPRQLGIMRIDFAVDVPDLPVQWFRETVRVAHKRWRTTVMGNTFYGEMGNGNIQMQAVKLSDDEPSDAVKPHRGIDRRVKRFQKGIPRLRRPLS